jgi:hypothetical protein
MPLIDATSQGETASGTSLTIAHTCSGSDRLLEVAAATFTSGAGDPPLPTATYAGVAMQQKTNTLFGAANDERITLFELVAPATGANNIVVSASPATEIVLVGLSLTDNDQATPSGTATATAPDGVTSVSQNVASEAGDLALDVVGFYNATLTVGAGQTQRVYNNNGASFESVALSTEPGAATVTMSESFAASENPGHIVVNLNAAAAPTMAVIHQAIYRGEG